jgi:imidazolonepropionase-like amidohydrolase
MARRGTILDATLTVHGESSEYPQDAAIMPVFAAEIVRRARRLGVPIAAGHDGGDPTLLHVELELLVHEGGLTPLEALASATSVAGRAIGIDEVVGTVAPGYQADLVVLTADPTDRIENTQEVAMVIKRGEVVFDSSIRKEDPDGGGTRDTPFEPR